MPGVSAGWAGGADGLGAAGSCGEGVAAGEAGVGFGFFAGLLSAGSPWGGGEGGAEGEGGEGYAGGPEVEGGGVIF